MLRYLSIFALMMVFPSESVMPFAGYISSTGNALLVGVIIAGTLGSTFGSVCVYFVSRQLGQEAAHRVLNRYGKWLGITPKKTRQANAWFDAHQRTAVFFGRFLPGLRTAVSIPAGLQRMNFFIFLTYTMLGSGIWIAFISFLGFEAKEQYVRVQSVLGDAGIVASALVVVIFFAVVWSKKRS